VIAVLSATPLLTWTASVLPTAAAAAFYTLAAIASLAALVVIQVNVGLRIQDGAALSTAIVVIAGVAAWAVAMVLALGQSPGAILSTIAAAVLLSRALKLGTDRRCGGATRTSATR
jgi:hypothetical protein